MFGVLLGKKRLSEEKVCNLLVNHTLEAAEAIWPIVQEHLEQSPHFEHSPGIMERSDDQFLLAVITCNIARLSKVTEPGQDKRLAQQLLEKFAKSLSMDTMTLAKEIKSCKSLMSRLNYPSKNIVYGLPRVIFERYELIDCQDEHFTNMKAPNPIELKNLNGLLEPLIWDFEFLNEEFKIV